VDHYRELTKDEYLATMRAPMRLMGIEEPSPTPGLSIKGCVREALPLMGPQASLDSSRSKRIAG
jgi:hypothetical protein